ncbi:MAG: pyridoxal-phosphate dependent enzyme [Pseudomonadota bacterium]
MAGQAMIADEVIRESDTPFDYCFLQIGGGGMAGATAAMLKREWSNIKIIGVEGVKQASMKASVEAGAPVTLDSVDTFCDGTAVTRPGDLTFQVCKEFIDEYITVTNDDVSAAMRQLWESKRLIPEPSGAMGVAGIMQYAKEHANEMEGKKVLSIICGANMDFSKLSTIARKSSATGDKRRYYRIQMPEGKGSLLRILEAHFQNFNVVEFMYGKIADDDAWQTIAIDARSDEFSKLEASISAGGHNFEEITKDPDIRYRLINYNPATFNDPLFMNVEFPERKGALRDFLRAISNNASICYFNYAYSGEVIGRALMGFEFEDDAHKQKFLSAIKTTHTKCAPIDPDTEKRILQH